MRTYKQGTLERYGNPSDDALEGASGRTAFTLADGSVGDPATVTIRFRRPDGTILLYGWPMAGLDGLVIRESLGRFYVPIAFDQPGTWAGELASTGDPTVMEDEQFYVLPRKVPG